MNWKLIGLLAVALLPAVVHLIEQAVGSFGIGLIFRLIVHVLVPVIFVSYFTKVGYLEAFLVPLRFKNRGKVFWYSLIGSVGALFFIFGALYIFFGLLDFNAMSISLSKIGVNSNTFPLVALMIVLTTPFIEEYFWRGFVFRAFDKYTSTWIAYLTGLLFAVHHVIIFSDWFNWWQFLLVTVFLAVVGVLFNYAYKKTGSIYASWIVHIVADAAIMIVGFLYVF